MGSPCFFLFMSGWPLLHTWTISSIELNSDLYVSTCYLFWQKKRCTHFSKKNRLVDWKHPIITPTQDLDRDGGDALHNAFQMQGQRRLSIRIVEMIGVFPKVWVPQNGWFIRENPIRIDDLGVPLFLETPIGRRYPNIARIVNQE